MTVAYEADQLTLLGEPRVRHSDGDTSRDAARAVQQFAGQLENLILQTFSLEDGLTDDELAARLPERHPPTVKTCRSRLSKRGLLMAAGQRRNGRGRLQTIWRICNG